jgi:hypothetical protein
MGVFCYHGTGAMNDVDMDGGNGIISKRYDEEYYLPCNFGGLTLGKYGEEINLTTLDIIDSDYNNIGFIYCSAQGSENFIFSKSIKLITNNRPVIFFKNNKKCTSYQFDKIIESYPCFKQEGVFDIINYCTTYLNYKVETENDFVLLIPK